MAFLDETGLAEVWSLIGQKHAKIEFGSYTGTGTYGSSNPNSITFNFVPSFLFIYCDDYYDFKIGLGTDGGDIRSYAMQGEISPQLKATWSGKTVSWYDNAFNSASVQLNTSNDVYKYIAIGLGA